MAESWERFAIPVSGKDPDGEEKVIAVDADGNDYIVSNDITDILDGIEHVSGIFPGDTNLTITLVAGQAANAWGAWTEIVDSGATKLSASFAANPGHITSIVIETISDDAAIYMYEIAYGAAKTVITRGRFAGVGKFQQAHIQDRFWAPPFPMGELIYYRMKTETAVADTCTAHLRYHVHE